MGTLRPVDTEREHPMHALRLGAAALIAAGSLLSADGAKAVGLDSLVAGGALTDGDLTFDGFTFSNVGSGFGGLGIGAGDLDVTLSTTDTTATLLFDFVPDVSVGVDAFFEITGSVSGAVTAGPRTFVETTLTLLGSSIGGSGFPVVEVGQTVPTPFELLNLVTDSPSGATLIDTSALAGLTGFTHGWDAVGEGDAGVAGIGGFSITYRLDGVRPPDPDPVPLPAGLPLMLGAIGTFAVLRRRAVRAA